MKVVNMSRCSSHAKCPDCGNEMAGRHSIRERLVIDIERYIKLSYSMHKCRLCDRTFPNPATLHIVGAYRKYSRMFIQKAVTICNKEASDLEDAAIIVLKRFGHSVAPSTLHDWTVDNGGYDWREKGTHENCESNTH